MIFAILTLVLAAIVYLPQLWVRTVMRRHSVERRDLDGTGGELAQHLLQRFELEGVSLEKTDAGKDHYDPTSKTVRLSPSNYDGRSITAVAVATHEVGHAIQFYKQEKISRLRSRYLPLAFMLKRVGIMVMMAMPILAIVLRAPPLILAVVALSVVLQLLGALAYLIILPEEWDASFHKALPILIEGNYIDEKDLQAVTTVLRAAALTYFASALAEILNIGRWLMLILRR